MNVDNTPYFYLQWLSSTHETHIEGVKFPYKPLTPKLIFQ